MILFGMLTRIVNGIYFVKVRHLTRVKVVTSLTFLSFIMIATACVYNKNPNFFWVAVASSILTGVA
jgi:hypothetical protein